ncbi:nickel/cobalt ABC transporter permease [Paenibacillus sanguinis]|uniref:nickel/cobalt ABC transporter permease n=1 Tax=Paenibacillus sanguinis TaxID=225906 RepID=UPI00035FE80E|nr:nickel/cobalt ABC transporter permease [Paenibacillus sanguinis]
MNYFKRLKQDKLGMLCLVFLGLVSLAGLLAPLLAPHDPTLVRVDVKLAMPSAEYPLGTDHLGRCLLSRILFGIRTTFFYAFLAMVVTMISGVVFGMLAGYSKGKVREAILRVCDVMLSFPSEVMILAIVGVLGPGILNIVIANILSKWAWYTRMIYSSVQQYRSRNYVKFAQVHQASTLYIMRKHIVPGIAGEVTTHSTLEMGWVILSISSLSFLGLGVQPPTPEWGMMLNEAKNVLFTHPWQMIPAGLTILLVVVALNFLGDSMQQAMNANSYMTTHKPQRRLLWMWRGRKRDHASITGKQA